MKVIFHDVEENAPHKWVKKYDGKEVEVDEEGNLLGEAKLDWEKESSNAPKLYAAEQEKVTALLRLKQRILEYYKKEDK